MHVPFNAFASFDKLQEFDQLMIPGMRDRIVYISKFQKIQKQNRTINNDLSGIDFQEGNDSIVSLNNQNTSILKQRIMTSTEENSYATGYKPKRERMTYMTTRTDENKSLIKQTEDSRERHGDQDQTFTKFFSQEDDDPLNRPSLDDPRFTDLIKNRSRAYVTTAPIFQKKRMMVERKERIEEIKDFKELNKSMFSLFNENNKTQLSLKVRKAKEIKNIMRREQTQEKQRNLRMLNYLNNKEKVRNREIRSQHQQERKNKNIVMKIMINRMHHNNIMKREDARFVNNFNQAKNIIEKQMFKGKLIKEKRNIRFENVQKKHVTKQSRSFMSHQAIQNKVFDSFISNPNIKSTHDHESVKNYSTIINQENINRDNQYFVPDETYNDIGGLRNKSQKSKRASIISSQNPIFRKSTTYMNSRFNHNSGGQKLLSNDSSFSNVGYGSKRNLEKVRGILSNPDNDEIIQKYKHQN